MLEVKPLNKNLKNNSLILHIVWYVTFVKAYINSFSILYKILFTLSKFKVKNSYINIFHSLLVLFFWLIIRIITSLPRTVIIDSYKWSLNFRYPINYWLRVIKSGNIKREFRGLFESNILYNDIFNKIMPLSFLRIYRDDSSKWNFNPNNNELLKLMQKGYNSHNVMSTLKYLSGDKQTYLGHLDRLRILNVRTDITKIPHLTAFSEVGHKYQNNSTVSKFYGVNQTSSYSEDSISKIYILDAKKNPVYIRSIFFKDYNIVNFNPVTFYDSRLMWSNFNLFKLDYFLSSVQYKEFLVQNTLSLKKDNYFINDYFSSFVDQISKPKFNKSFESLDFFEKQSFIAVLGNELDSYSSENVEKHLINIRSIGFIQFDN